MNDETRARLKKYADAKRGRKNLASLDQTLGMIAFDKVQDADGERPKVTLRAVGFAEVWDDTRMGTGVIRDKGFSAWFKCTRVRKEPITNHCPWVRLKHCQDWQIAELAKRWPSRMIAVKTYQGPNRPSRWDTVTVHPVDVVIAWLRFLWPEPEEWGERAVKYLVGFTDKYVHDFPGVGAKLLLKSIPAGSLEPLYAPTQLIVDSMDGYGRASVAFKKTRLMLEKNSQWEILG